MSASTNSTGGVLGAATAAGLLGSGVTSWQVATTCCGCILLLGIFLLLITRRRKRREAEQVINQ